MTPKDDLSYRDKLSASLDKHSDQLDYTTQMRLKQARQRALSQSIDHTRQKRWWTLVIPSVATSAIVAYFAIVNVFIVSAPPVDDKAMLYQDIELLATDEELGLIEQLEFYEWLEKDAADELDS